MTKLLKSLWRVITFPFVLVFNIVAFPFRLIRRAHKFLNKDLEEDRPLLETFASIAAEEQARASLWDHVEALRAHLLRIVIALAVGVGISFYFTIPLMEFLAGPVHGLKNLQAIEVTEEFGVFMRVALTSGIAIMLPYIAFEIWLFVAPGLRPRERKMGLAGIPLATILFLSGMAFTFFSLIPAALPFLGNFTAISQFWTAREYFKFVTGLMLWIGLFFEFAGTKAAAKFLWPLPDTGVIKRLPRIKAHTIVVTGAGDRFVPPAYGQVWRNQLEWAEAKTILDAGHLANLEQPNRFATIAGSWFMAP